MCKFACVNKGVNNEEGINLLMVFIDVFFSIVMFLVAFIFPVLWLSHPEDAM